MAKLYFYGNVPGLASYYFKIHSLEAKDYGNGRRDFLRKKLKRNRLKYYVSDTMLGTQWALN